MNFYRAAYYIKISNFHLTVLVLMPVSVTSWQSPLSLLAPDHTEQRCSDGKSMAN